MYSHVFTDLVLTEYDATEITTVCQNDNPIFLQCIMVILTLHMERGFGGGEGGREESK